MKIKKAFAPLFMVGVLSLGLLLSGCGSQAGDSSTSSQNAAKSQFLAERGGGATPGTGSTASGTPVPGSAGNGGIPRVFGTVEKVEGNKITIKSASDGTETVVHLASNATVHKQVAGQVSDIKVGDTVSASGAESGDTLSAQVVQIGTGGFGGFGGFGAGGARGGSGVPGVFPDRTPGAGRNGGSGAFPSGTPPAGFAGRGQANASGTPGVGHQFLFGTVEKVDGDTVTLKTQDGSTATFKTGTDTRVQKQVEVPVNEIAVGTTIVATGTGTGNGSASGSGGVFEAASVQLVEGFAGQNTPATPQP